MRAIGAAGLDSFVEVLGPRPESARPSIWLGEQSPSHSMSTPTMALAPELAPQDKMHQETNVAVESSPPGDVDRPSWLPRLAAKMGLDMAEVGPPLPARRPPPTLVADRVDMQTPGQRHSRAPWESGAWNQFEPKVQ